MFEARWKTSRVLGDPGVFARTNEVDANKREASNGRVVRVDNEIKLKNEKFKAYRQMFGIGPIWSNAMF